MGDGHLRRRPGQSHRTDPRDPLPAFARAAVLGVHLVHRLQGQLGRVQADGFGALRRAEVRRPHPRPPDRPEARRIVPARHVVLRLLPRAAHDVEPVPRALRRSAAAAGIADHAARDGHRRVDSEGRRGSDVGGGTPRARGDGDAQPLPRRRRGAELRRQRAHPARGPLRERLDSAGGRRRGRRARRGAPHPAPVARQAQAGPDAGRPGRIAARPAGGGRRHPGLPRRRRGRLRGVRGRGVPVRRGGRSAGRRAGRRLVPGPHGVRAARPRLAQHPGRRPQPRDAVRAEPQDQVPGVVPAVRAVRAPRAGRGLVRDAAAREQSLHAVRRAGSRGPVHPGRRGTRGLPRARPVERAAVQRSRPSPTSTVRHASRPSTPSSTGATRPCCAPSRRRPAAR